MFSLSLECVLSFVDIGRSLQNILHAYFFYIFLPLPTVKLLYKKQADIYIISKRRTGLGNEYLRAS